MDERLRESRLRESECMNQNKTNFEVVPTENFPIAKKRLRKRKICALEKKLTNLTINHNHMNPSCPNPFKGPLILNKIKNRNTLLFHIANTRNIHQALSRLGTSNPLAFLAQLIAWDSKARNIILSTWERRAEKSESFIADIKLRRLWITLEKFLTDLGVTVPLRIRITSLDKAARKKFKKDVARQLVPSHQMSLLNQHWQSNNQEPGYPESQPGPGQHDGDQPGTSQSGSPPESSKREYAGCEAGTSKSTSESLAKCVTTMSSKDGGRVSPTQPGCPERGRTATRGSPRRSPRLTSSCPPDRYTAECQPGRRRPRKTPHTPQDKPKGFKRHSTTEASAAPQKKKGRIQEGFGGTKTEGRVAKQGETAENSKLEEGTGNLGGHNSPKETPVEIFQSDSATPTRTATAGDENENFGQEITGAGVHHTRSADEACSLRATLEKARRGYGCTKATIILHHQDGVQTVITTMLKNLKLIQELPEPVAANQAPHSTVTSVVNDQSLPSAVVDDQPLPSAVASDQMWSAGNDVYQDFLNYLDSGIDSGITQEDLFDASQELQASLHDNRFQDITSTSDAQDHILPVLEDAEVADILNSNLTPNQLLVSENNLEVIGLGDFENIMEQFSNNNNIILPPPEYEEVPDAAPDPTPASTPSPTPPSMSGLQTPPPLDLSPQPLDLSMNARLQDARESDTTDHPQAFAPIVAVDFDQLLQSSFVPRTQD